MASSNDNLCHILTENGVNSLLNTLVYGERKFLVWTRLSLENRSWVLNASDGIDVWRLEMDEEHIDSYRALAQLDTCEAFLTKIRSDFHLGHLMISPEGPNVIVMFGTAQCILRIDLYEASPDDRKAELQHLILWMADNITTLTDRLKATTEDLERVKNQKEPSPSEPTTFDMPTKPAPNTTIKRKPGYSLVNPGGRNLPAVLNEPPADNDEGTTHISVLSGSKMLDVYRCPDPPRCHFPCTKSNRRYHCPLCDNKPQKPGRMRRHFFTMHAGRHVIEHEGYRILRCKLKCTRANGRITDSSHYHCCLCGRVCLRKVHLCCHLQAHALGTAKDVDDEMMDVSKTDEDQEEEEQEDEDEGDDETTEDAVLQASQVSCPVEDAAQNLVTLADGTQVVYVQSMENGETITVVPVSSQSNTPQLSATGQLNPSLDVLSSSQSNNDIQDLAAMSQDQQDLETILREEGNREMVAGEAVAPTNTTPTMSTFHTYTSGIPEPQRQLSFDQSYNELANDQSNANATNLVVYEGNEDPTRLKSDNLPCELNTESPIQLTGVNNGLNLNDLVSATPATASLVTSMQSTPAMSTALSSQPMATPLENESLIASDTQLGQTPSNNEQRTSRGSDCVLLLKGDNENHGDDSVFSKLFSNTKPQVDSIFQHASVIAEGTNVEISRCKNTECDCRLYHCPLCTCLPNKPGRIREHFRKIHAENLIIRYQGYQMLRCKLGCCRSTGKRILNSHYHCCLCGSICISKSGVYEHMRTQHADISIKKDTDSTQQNPEKRKSTANLTPPAQKKQAMDECQVDPKPAEETTPRAPLVVQIPSVRNNQRVQGPSGIEQQGDMSTTNVNQQSNDTNTSSNPPQQQPLVIVMPQQIQNNTQTPNQQPIVIVMPQGGNGGGVQMAQPYVVSMPQIANN